MPYYSITTINCKLVTVCTKESYYFKQFKINVIIIDYTFYIYYFIKNAITGRRIDIAQPFYEDL